MLELERRGSEFAYVRTEEGYKVDFLARYPGSHQELIQVCADLSDPTTRQCEIRALQEAAKEHPKAALHLISLEPEIRADVPPKGAVHSAAAWLLSKVKNRNSSSRAVNISVTKQIENDINPLFSKICIDLTVANGIQEVVGSIPISSTITFQQLDLYIRCSYRCCIKSAGYRAELVYTLNIVTSEIEELRLYIRKHKEKNDDRA